MNPYFLATLVLVALFIWTVGSYFFWRISQKSKAQVSQKSVQPVFRLADQWIAESQKKIEGLIQRAEQPLSTAQHELLELRLEASRLPQGVKNLRLVRESMSHAIQPIDLQKSLPDITRLYLDEGDFRMVDDSLICLKTSLGEMPCLEIESRETPLSEAQMKILLSQVNQTLTRLSPDLVAGGFLYFGNEGDYQACLGHPEWMEGLKTRRLMVIDFKGLTSLLISLRLSKDVNRVIEVFERGVQTTLALEGQADKMNDALSILSAHSLKTRMVVEGNPPNDLKASREP